MRLPNIVTPSFALKVVETAIRSYNCDSLTASETTKEAIKFIINDVAELLKEAEETNPDWSSELILEYCEPLKDALGAIAQSDLTDSVVRDHLINELIESRWVVYTMVEDELCVCVTSDRREFTSDLNYLLNRI